MERSCLFCLDPIEKRQDIQNPIGCSCQIDAHNQCLSIWFQEKNQMECPICHAVSIPNPFMTPQVQVVYIQTPIPRENRSRKKIIMVCCCMNLLLWFIMLNVIRAIYPGNG